MEAPRLERKLVAILAADVEGYSRHMERDMAVSLERPATACWRNFRASSKLSTAR